VLGRARADAGPLVLAVVVVALTVVLTLVTPRLADRTADAAVRAAVAAAQPDVVVTVPFVETDGPRVLPTGTADEVADVAARLEAALPEELGAVLDPPLATVATRRLRLTLPTGELGNSALTLSWVWRGGPPEATWVDGRAPEVVDTGAVPAPEEGTEEGTGGDTDAQAGPVEVALSEASADLLAAGPGDALVVHDAGRALDVVVSGVFRPADPADPVWAHAPGLLEPRVRGSGLTTETLVAALLSDSSLPVARLTVEPSATTRTYTFPVAPDAFDGATAQPVAAAVAGIQAAPPALGLPGVEARVETRLGDVLLDADAQVRVAQAQAAVLLAGVVSVAALVLVLTARLVVRRRAAVLAHRRARGGTLAGVAAELLAESLVVAVLGGGAGVAVAASLVPGPTSWAGLAPVAVVTLVAVPLLGVLASATATGGRRAPANLHQRRLLGRARRLR
ncbi:hypothetical protein ICW40_20330, partial [Actinotalea ferrariae]|nr:hypothetical protein [Actinotalea ferrariae]